MSKPSFEMASDTRLLRQCLEKLEVGKEVSYRELSDLISRPVSGGTPALQSAIRSLLKGNEMVFSVVRGSGVRRLTDSEILRSTDRDIRGIRRKARNSAHKITAVANYAALSGKDKLQHTIKLSVLAVVSEITTEKAMTKIGKAVGGRAGELPIRETLAAFT